MDKVWGWLCIGFFAQILFAFGGWGGIIVCWLFFGGIALYEWVQYKQNEVIIYKDLKNGTYGGIPFAKKSPLQEYYNSLPGNDGQLLMAAKNVYYREMTNKANKSREDKLRNAAGGIEAALNGNLCPMPTDLYKVERHGENLEKIDLIIKEWVWDTPNHGFRHLEEKRRYPVNY